jgi:Ca-activated chloride channel family protein
MSSNSIFKFGAAALAALAFVGYFWVFSGPEEPQSGRSGLTRDDALAELAGYVETIKPRQQFTNWRAPVPLGAEPSLEDTLPKIEKFPLAVDPATNVGDVVVEIFSSTEKSGKGSDGWLVTVAEEFNKKGVKLAGGHTAKVKVRYIPSGTGYQYIGSGKYLPGGFTPSNELWIKMAEGRGVRMTPISDSMVSNLAGVVMKTRVADTLKTQGGTLNIKNLIDAVSQGKLSMGYTDPFASSTGLNFLVTVLQTFSGGDDTQLLSPDVASAFEVFQRSVPFVALTTIQMRQSVNNDGSLDAFVMEYQTFLKDKSLSSGYEFIPFGVPHDNPLYAVGDLPEEKLETLRAFAEFSKEPAYTARAEEYDFKPHADYQPPYAAPAGELIIRAQNFWKEKKYAGRPIAAVFLCDVSGSMSGTRIHGVREALKQAATFIPSDSSIGVVTFSNEVSILLPIKKFDLNQKGALLATAQSIQEGGGTAMYDGVAVALSMLAEEQKKQPDLKPMLFVLTDGETNHGLSFDNMRGVIEGINVPVFTIGYEADITELQRLSSVVEAASLQADSEDIAYKLSTIFNAEM